MVLQNEQLHLNFCFSFGSSVAENQTITGLSVVAHPPPKKKQNKKNKTSSAQGNCGCECPSSTERTQATWLQQLKKDRKVERKKEKQRDSERDSERESQRKCETPEMGPHAVDIARLWWASARNLFNLWKAAKPGLGLTLPNLRRTSGKNGMRNTRSSPTCSRHSMTVLGLQSRSICSRFATQQKQERMRKSEQEKERKKDREREISRKTKRGREREREEEERERDETERKTEKDMVAVVGLRSRSICGNLLHTGLPPNTNKKDKERVISEKERQWQRERERKKDSSWGRD